MQSVDITYNPYKMMTTLKINGFNVNENDDYIHFREFVGNNTPLQTWIEPITYKNWKGFLSELCVDDTIFDKVEIHFTGRSIDFEDFKRVCVNDNKKRQVPLELEFFLEKELSDEQFAAQIDVVMNTLLSEKFAKLIEERGQNSQVAMDYQILEKNYNNTKNREFNIVFAGLYSSGKSTLLNALIRHEILPTAGDTCTSKTCRIKHTETLDGKISLECFDKEGNTVVPLEIFESDEACLNRFWEITPLNSLVSNPESVSVIELGLDLSHLYPDADMKEAFNLVIIDTPGCNSVKTTGEDFDINMLNDEESAKKLFENLDEQIAIDAITGENKDIVIICADSQDYKDESIGGFLKAIYEVMADDGGDFNDRFLFVLNKCDALIYDDKENLLSKKEKYAMEYLMDVRKWGIDLEDRTPTFIPRIFMTSAYVDYAIQQGAAEFTKEEIREDKTKKKKSMYQEYSKFAENVFDYKDENYYLSTVCDIPEYHKQEIRKQYKSLLSKDEAAALRLQTGVGCIEQAIKDYISRYAYPFKVRDLVNTFDSILEDVKGFIDAEDEILKERLSELGKHTSEREGVEEERLRKIEKNDKLNILSIKVKVQKAEIDNIKFDSGMLQKIRMNLEMNIENNDWVRFIRTSSKKDFSRPEILDLTKKLEMVFSVAWKKANHEFALATSVYRKQLETICEKLKSVVTDMESETDYYLYGYHFSSSISFEKIKRLNAISLRDGLIESDATRSLLELATNPTKEESQKWDKFDQLIQAAFSYNFELKNSSTHRYTTKPLLDNLASLLACFRTLCKVTEIAYLKDCDRMKRQAEKIADDLIVDITLTNDKINEYQEKIMAYGDDIQAISQEIEFVNERKDWLQSLIDDINVGGAEYV